MRWLHTIIGSYCFNGGARLVNRSNIAETRWLGYHAIVAPFGIFATTWLLAVSERGQWEWDAWNSIPALAVLVDLGAVVYAMAAVIVDLGGRTVFWAWEQWKKDRERRDELVRASLLNEFRDQWLADLSAELRAEFRDQWRAELGSEFRAGEKRRLAEFLEDGGTVEEWLQEPAQENGSTAPNGH